MSDAFASVGLKSLDIHLLHGDCLAIMPLVAAGTIDAILTDLPYGSTKCKWDTPIDLQAMWLEYWRILKPNGLIMLFGTQPFMSTLISSGIDWFKFCYVWEKNCPTNIAQANVQPLRYTEEIAVFYRKQPTYNKQMIARSESGKKLIEQYQKNNTTFKLSTSEVTSGTATEVDPNKYDAATKNPSNLLKFGVERGKRRFHETQKPVALLEYLIKAHTNPGDVVLDSCMGSGSTVIAANNLGRKAIGIEKDAGIFGVAVDRIGMAEIMAVEVEGFSDADDEK